MSDVVLLLMSPDTESWADLFVLGIHKHSKFLGMKVDDKVLSLQNERIPVSLEVTPRRKSQLMVSFLQGNILKEL